MNRTLFGILPDGRTVHLFELKNAQGVAVRISNYGGIVQSIKVPDRDGTLVDIVLGYDDLAGYLTQTAYFGALIGRNGNRIAKARFQLDGKTYPLFANIGADHLHGGRVGFDKVLWTASPGSDSSPCTLQLSYESIDGEEGYPGTLQVEVVYGLTDGNELTIDYTAVTDQPTPVNLTHHSYFNLAGQGDILDHEMCIHSDRITAVNAHILPTGELRPVVGTPFDFTSAHPIGARIEEADDQLIRAGGYDHNYVLSQPQGAGSSDRSGLATMVLAARVTEPRSGRWLEVETTEPGIQFYSGNSLGPAIEGKAGQVYSRHSGFCLETQHFPDAPNQPAFPSTILRPGERYRSRTLYRFGVDEEPRNTEPHRS